ncbi:hypothetical protein K435DRAFT_102883 [Dendrothele bispora CBS 962.96]|uniref:Uncharacterized protein n=1 Tax=Dendrothele bispora (strain CBS 962.96) TaxID=1314807 RepID=A0A4S8M242_DENBC|nr:hypothetical protein K435DRAFT_102883 [Dendrothele bispora CBS 962.96]
MKNPSIGCVCIHVVERLSNDNATVHSCQRKVLYQLAATSTLLSLSPLFLGDFHVTQNLASASSILHYQPPVIHDNTRILITRSRFSTTMTFQLKSCQCE